MEANKYESGILIASCAAIEPSLIAKLIVGTDHVSVKETENDSIEAYPWHISTKYYETDVLIYTLSQKQLLPEKLAGGVQAIILAFDSLQENGLEMVTNWQPFLKHYEADISILLCNRCAEEPTTGVSKLSAQEWCVKNGYELVELDPELDAEWEAEQDFVETTGIKRVVQALHAHVWPDLVLKERTEPTSMSALLHGVARDEEENESLENDMNQLKMDSLPSDLEFGNFEERLDELLGCGAETDFFQLFGELQTMKERVSSLPSDQRKTCAEQVVMAFWRAIGGDQEEVDITDEPPSS